MITTRRFSFIASGCRRARRPATDKSNVYAGKTAATQAFSAGAVGAIMATISVGEGKGRRRALTHDLPLVPFIDFMVCLIAFLIVTAVYTQLSRIPATAQAPGGEHGPTTQPPKELHVVASSAGFDLRWQQGKTVLESQHVARVPVQVGDEQRYPALTEAITKEWQSRPTPRRE
jgi:biopolymer transport protein ExbD